MYLFAGLFPHDLTTAFPIKQAELDSFGPPVASTSMLLPRKVQVSGGKSARGRFDGRHAEKPFYRIKEAGTGRRIDGESEAAALRRVKGL